jgi:hypothetical protein
MCTLAHCTMQTGKSFTLSHLVPAAVAESLHRLKVAEGSRVLDMRLLKLSGADLNRKAS